MTQPFNSSSPPPPPSSLSFVALVVVEQPAVFVDGMACFDGCHGHHDILHCSVVGTVWFLLLQGPSLLFCTPISSIVAIAIDCFLVSHTHLYSFYTWCTKCKNKYIFGIFILCQA